MKNIKGIENFIVGYILSSKPLKEMGYYLRKEYEDLSYNDSVTILNKVLESCKELNLILNLI